ncbi:DUF302 domain-containing protein [Dyella monticola]|uniref:DUF302 domain-containing protein n=1 Tax=Dyella monticola TaxID=1927958 RepID=A0A370WUU7_9GAMM|nr:DUF302 domain-containing protein [Dyella monticola]RDS79806.1 DUF302 domain-containing protein [Dyella monticola]
MTRSTESSGVLRFASNFSFDVTVQRLHAAFAAHGIKVFATIDQQAEAVAVGLSMPPTTLIVFGSPKAGTPLMLANPAAGIDLPLKVLIVESGAGNVEAFMNTAKYVIERHALSPAFEANLSPVERLVANTLTAAKL